MKYKNTKML